MKTRLASALAVSCFLAIHTSRAQDAPRLEIQWHSFNQVQLRWGNDGAGFVLEESPSLASPLWTHVPQIPGLVGNDFVVTLDATGATRFLRLRFDGYTTIEQSSPADGEPGVAVTRETILRFTRPLAASTVLTTNHFHAGFGGRRLLSRVELSSDRKTATLFYLEPLPGSTRVVAVFDGNDLTDAMGLPLDADGDGVPGGQAVIGFDTLSLTPVAGTAVIGTVFASELMPGPDTGTNAVDRPLAGVTITVDGMEQTLRTRTDTNGYFRLEPVPAGQFFVHIDGRTVTNLAENVRYPDLSYYPAVGKAWTAVAGRTNNIAGFMPGSTNAASSNGWIFLPLITQGTLQPVSMTNDTTITFPPSVIASNPALAGVTITVPANSLYSDNGTRGGKVGIAPVPPDRLPGPLPPGLEFPLVITVQTDGPLNFDRPVPICFPNLPDPVLGVPLPANSKQALISFNHDKGIWEAVGSMTVSADGNFVCTDPGAGILQPGWHGVGQAPSGPPPPGDDPPKRCRPSERRRDRCLFGCEQELAACKLRAQDSVRFGGYECDELADDGKDASGCFAEIDAKFIAAFKLCVEQKEFCDKACEECFGNPPPPPGAGAGAFSSSWLGSIRGQPVAALAALAGPDDPVADQIAAIIEEIIDLIRPFTSTRSAIPADVRDQILNLLDQADLAAGGDAGAYLRNKIIAAEEEIAAITTELELEPEDLDLGNAPAYPVLYLATIIRPDGFFFLRGETAPFGQYSLFVPRDGTLLDVSFYDPRTKTFGLIAPNLSLNARFSLPRFTLFPVESDAADFDRDGLPDLVENVFGTEPINADTDGDGIFDGAEIDQGTNPLDGLPVQTGIIATAKTPGPAVDVWAGNDLVVTAEGTAGVSVFNAYRGMTPVLVAHVPTPGNAQRLAGSGNHLAVAAGEAGLLILDLSSPAEARILHQVRLGTAQAVTAGGGVAYVGQSSGTLVAVELATGLVVGQVVLPEPVADLALAGDHLYVRANDRLFVISPANGEFAVAGSVSQPSRAGQNQRLFVGGGVAWSVHIVGYDTFDIANPASPKLLTAGNTTQFGWRQIVPNGSGLGLAVVGPNPGENSQRDLSLYDLSDPLRNDVFVTQFVTPGIARAVALLDGLAYVADDTAGLQVINYLPYDAKGVPPTITLGTSALDGQVEEGALVRVTATARDDVQVRNVEFYVDGVRAFTDGNFPFEHRFTAPALTATRTNLILRARAIDTGGNATSTAELTITLVPDQTAPRVVATAPVGGGRLVSSVSAYFNEPIDPATLNPAAFQLVSAGADGLLDTADDLLFGGGVVGYDEERNEASLAFAAPLPDGLYRALLTDAVADRAGNRLPAGYAWPFRVADAVFWSSRTGGWWDDAANWSTGTVPGPADAVFIDSIPGDVVITHTSGTISIKSLVLGERMVCSGGTLQVAGVLRLDQSLTLRGGTLVGGTVRENGARLIFPGSSTSTLDGVTVEGDLELTNTAARVVIRNGLTLAGNVVLDNSGTLVFSGTQTFNTGQVIFAGNSSGVLEIAPGTTLTLGPAVVVRGKGGSIGLGAFGTRKLINQGVIAADVAGGTLNIFCEQFENAGTLECKNGGSITFFSVVNWVNQAVMTAGGGGALTLNGTWSNQGTITMNEATVNLGGAFTPADLGTLNRTGGTVNLTGVLDLGGGTLTLDAATGPWRMNNGTFKNGTIKQTGVGRLGFSTAGNTLDGMSIEGDLELTNTSARALIRNGLTLAGNVVLDNAGTIIFSGNQTFNTGQVIFAGDSAVLALEPGTTLTLGPAMVVRGKTGQIGASAFGAVKLINQGLIAADVAGGTITLINLTQFENAGTVECKNGGSITFFSGISWVNQAAMTASGGGALTLNGTWSNQGTFTMNEATVNLGGAFTPADLGAFNRTGGTVNLTGVLDLGGGTLALDATTGSWRMNGGTLKGGTVQQTAGSKLLFTAPNSVNTFDGMQVEGDLDLTTPNARALIRNGLTLVGNVILDNAGAITFAGDQTFNSGQVVFAGTPGILGIEPGTTLTLGPAMVVRGKSGNIGQNVLAFSGTRNLINQGLIAADVAGGTITIFPTEFENAGILRADGAGAILVIRATPFTNTGTIEELNGGDVQINP